MITKIEVKIWLSCLNFLRVINIYDYMKYENEGLFSIYSGQEILAKFQRCTKNVLSSCCCHVLNGMIIMRKLPGEFLKLFFQVYL